MKETPITPKKFIQVFINGDEKNLPKELKDKDGEFIEMPVYKKHGDDKRNWWIFNPKWDTKLWMDNIDWYLMPSSDLEQPEETHELYKAMGKWSEQVFPDSDSAGHLHKLLEETEEAINDPDNIVEYADCLLVIFAAAYKAEISFDHLVNAAKDKLNVNKSRKWERKENGIYQHVNDQAEACIHDNDLCGWRIDHPCGPKDCPAYDNEQPEEGQSKPTDYDIENAATDYMRDVIKASHDGLVMKCYTAGAIDMRDNNIYVSPNQPSRSEPGSEYHLICENCEKTFWSKDAFPKPQFCESCKAPAYASEIDQPQQPEQADHIPDVGKKIMTTSEEYYGLNGEKPKS